MRAGRSPTQTPDKTARTAAVQMTDVSGASPITTATPSPFIADPSTASTANTVGACMLEHHIECCGICHLGAVWVTKSGEFVRQARAGETDDGSEPGGRTGVPKHAFELDYDFFNEQDGACSDNESEVARRIDDTDRSEASDDFNYMTEPRSVVGKEYEVELEEPPIPSEYCEDDVKLEDGPSGTDEPPADQKDAADGASDQEDRVKTAHSMTK